MELKITKWRDGAISPVLFKIDDLANIYIKKSKEKKLQVGEDWGHFGSKNNSMWNFLFDNLLKKFPHIKTTFFLVTDKRSPMVINQSYTYNRGITGDINFINFLRILYANPNVELAYHGTTHGKAGYREEDFLQEWESYKSLNEAKSEINRGKELYKTVLGSYPTGGKYCGYAEGRFGKKSIANTDFKWWCYHEDNHIWDKNSTDSRYKYDLEFIKGVVNIPTTVDGSNLSLKILKRAFSRKYLKSIYMYLKEGKTVERHLDSLYNNGEVISVYEHTSPYMTSDTIQYPNIVTDMDNLNHIFSILSKKDVWYATCNELADYFIDRSKSTIDINGNDFKIVSKESLNSAITVSTPFEGKKLSLYDTEDDFLADFIHKRDELYITYAFEVNKVYRVR
jgi:hypothetical protein